MADVVDLLEIVDLPPNHSRWVNALPVLQELRPALTRELLAQVLEEGTPQGLRFTAAFDGEACLGVAGWRILANTSAIRKLYIDDLVTVAESRSRGVGARLVSELTTRAKAAGCSVLDLDSGVQRYGAHRFYLRQRMDISAHHFTLVL